MPASPYRLAWNNSWQLCWQKQPCVRREFSPEKIVISKYNFQTILKAHKEQKTPVFVLQKCSVSEQRWLGHGTMIKLILILMPVNSSGLKDPPSWDMSCQMWAGTHWTCEVSHASWHLRCQLLYCPSPVVISRCENTFTLSQAHALMVHIKKFMVVMQGLLMFFEKTCLWEAGQREIGKSAAILEQQVRQ